MSKAGEKKKAEIFLPAANQLNWRPWIRKQARCVLALETPLQTVYIYVYIICINIEAAR